VKAGDLRERVQVLRAVSTRDQYNAERLTWPPLLTVWARVAERGGRAPLVADRPVMVVGYEVTLRSPLPAPVADTGGEPPAGVTLTHLDRLLWRGKTLAIETITPLPAEGLMVLRCLEAEA
jgi:hypothetical protein